MDKVQALLNMLGVLLERAGSKVAVASLDELREFSRTNEATAVLDAWGQLTVRCDRRGVVLPSELDVLVSSRPPVNGGRH